MRSRILAHGFLYFLGCLRNPLTNLYLDGRNPTLTFLYFWGSLPNPPKGSRRALFGRPESEANLPLFLGALTESSQRPESDVNFPLFTQTHTEHNLRTAEQSLRRARAESSQSLCRAFAQTEQSLRKAFAQLRTDEPSIRQRRLFAKQQPCLIYSSVRQRRLLPNDGHF